MSDMCHTQTIDEGRAIVFSPGKIQFRYLERESCKKGGGRKFSIYRFSPDKIILP